MMKENKAWSLELEMRREYEKLYYFIRREYVQDVNYERFIRMCFEADRNVTEIKERYSDR